jgi:hypothetical protein
VVISNNLLESTSGLRPSPELAHEVPAGRALEEAVHNLGLGYTREA